MIPCIEYMCTWCQKLISYFFTKTAFSCSQFSPVYLVCVKSIFCWFLLTNVKWRDIFTHRCIASYLFHPRGVFEVGYISWPYLNSVLWLFWIYIGYFMILDNCLWIEKLCSKAKVCYLGGRDNKINARSFVLYLWSHIRV